MSYRGIWCSLEFETHSSRSWIWERRGISLPVYSPSILAKYLGPFSFWCFESSWKTLNFHYVHTCNGLILLFSFTFLFSKITWINLKRWQNGKLRQRRRRQIYKLQECYCYYSISELADKGKRKVWGLSCFVSTRGGQNSISITKLKRNSHVEPFRGAT